MATEATSKRRSQAERTALSESRMLRAALKLIARKGYSKTTLAEVGEEAGYSRGLAGHRFGSKEGLLRALIEHITERFFTDQVGPAIEGTSGIAALTKMTDVYLNELVVREERLHALYVLMGEALGPVPEIRDVFVELNAAFRENARRSIEAGVASGELRSDLDAEAEAAAIIGMLRGVAMQLVTDPDCFDLDRVRQTMNAMLCDHLLARDGAGR